MSKEKIIPERKDVKKEDQWNLVRLFENEEQWENTSYQCNLRPSSAK